MKKLSLIISILLFSSVAYAKPFLVLVPRGCTITLSDGHIMKTYPVSPTYLVCTFPIQGSMTCFHYANINKIKHNIFFEKTFYFQNFNNKEIIFYSGTYGQTRILIYLKRAFFVADFFLKPVHIKNHSWALMTRNCYGTYFANYK